jgi:hypothetical protein
VIFFETIDLGGYIMTVRRIIARFFALTLAVVSISAHAQLNASDGQFGAKLYTEGLGRMPDQSGWRGILNFWNANTCNQATLQSLANSVLTSSEFLSTSPSNLERAFRLYRSTLHRDPTQTEMTYAINQLNAGTSWQNVVSDMLASTEFANRVTINCSGNPSGWQAVAPYNQLSTNSGNVTTEATLRSALASAAPGSTIYIEQGAVITLGSTLVIPNGVTLATVGMPASSRAPLLGRLARNANFSGPLVEVHDGASLQSLWIDGQRNRFGFIQSAINIYVIGSNVLISNNMITDTPGWTNLQYLHAGTVCSGGQVTSNIITAYGSTHYAQSTGPAAQWADGISIACKDVLVDHNQIVDPTDVGIVVFHVYPDVQTSTVQYNQILNVGNAAYGGLVTDPLNATNLPGVPLSQILDFTGTNFSNNVVWSSPSVHIDFIIANGTRPWFGSNSFTGQGATFLSNNSGTETVTTVDAIAVSGMLATTVQSNNFSTLASPPAISANCLQRNVVVAPPPYAGDSASSLQPHTNVSSTDPIVVGCIGH